MWNNGNDLDWRHIYKIVDDQYFTTKGASRLTRAHVDLTSYSVMNVRLAAQTLSASTAVVLRYNKDASATAEFCEMANKFFDILNVRSQQEGTFQRNDDMKPFISKDDERLVWLKTTFLDYFSSSKESIEKREGFSKTEKEKMFISAQTYQGLKITVLSMVEIIPFLLDNGVKFVLTNKFNQDCLEQNFGMHRSMGGRSDNPNVYRFGYQAQANRVHRSVVPVKGNVAGGFMGKKQSHFHKVDPTELDKKRKRPRK